MRWGFWTSVTFVVCFLLYSMVTSVFSKAGDKDIAEALLLLPELQVARINANRWAI
jgi:hypothetical protein